MRKTSEYVLAAKAAAGNRRMSDREFGQLAGGFSSSSISDARYGKMSDNVALAVARIAGIDAGEVLMAARLQRESDPVISSALNAWAKKVLGRASQATTVAFVGAAVMLGLMWPLPDARMAVGGEGRFRPRRS